MIKILDNNGEVTFYRWDNEFLFDLGCEGIDLFNSIGESSVIVDVDAKLEYY